MRSNSCLTCKNNVLWMHNRLNKWRVRFSFSSTKWLIKMRSLSWGLKLLKYNYETCRQMAAEFKAHPLTQANLPTKLNSNCFNSTQTSKLTCSTKVSALRQHHSTKIATCSIQRTQIARPAAKLVATACAMQGSSIWRTRPASWASQTHRWYRLLKMIVGLTLMCFHYRP